MKTHNTTPRNMEADLLTAFNGHCRCTDTRPHDQPQLEPFIPMFLSAISLLIEMVAMSSRR